GVGDLVLDGEDVRQLAVVRLRPEVVAVGDVDQLGADPQPVAGLADAALQDGADAELFADLADVLVAALEGEGGGAGGDVQPLDPGQGADQLLGQAVAEVLVLGVGAEVAERQDGDGRGGGGRGRGGGEVDRGLELRRAGQGGPPQLLEGLG